MVIFSGLTYQANIEFSDILLYRNHDNLHESHGADTNLWDIMYTIMSDGSTLVKDINVKVVSLKPDISDAVTDVQTILLNASLIDNGVDELFTMMDAIDTKWDNHVISNTYTSPFFATDTTTSFPCVFCTTIAAQVASIKVEMQTKTDPIFADLSSMTTSTNDTLIQSKDVILEAIDGFNSSISAASENMDSFTRDVNDSRSDVEDINVKRELSYNILFVIPLVPLVFVIIGGLTKTSFCFTVGYILLWLSGVIMFILLAVHLPIAVMMTDVCDYMDMIDDNVTAYYPSDTGKVFQSCLDNDTLVDAFGLREDLNFTKAITFPTFTNISANFEFGGLASLNDDAQNESNSTFYGPGDAALILINALTGLPAWTRVNFKAVDIYTPTPIELHPDNFYTAPGSPSSSGSDPWEQLANAIDILYSEDEVSSQFTTAMTDIQSEVAAVTVKRDEIKENTQLVTDQANDAEVLLVPVFDIVDDIIDAARCDFIGEGYLSFHEVLCEDFMGVIARIVVAMIVVAAMSFVACCASFRMVRKSYWMNEQTNERILRKHSVRRLEQNDGIDGAMFVDQSVVNGIESNKQADNPEYAITV